MMGTANLNENIPSATRFQITPETLVKAYPNEQIALVHMKTRRIQILNRTASEVWKLLAAGKSRGEIQKLLLQDFNLTEDQITSDIDSVLHMLVREGLISLNQ